jgi:UDP-N-acetylmuramoyl-tripeptide--D-alanyl-D-alanine ligase
LGDMLELGKYTDEEHERIGTITAKIADILITIGLRAKNIVEGAEKGGLSSKKISSYDNVKEAIPYLNKIIKKGDVILVKGSQGMRLERVVAGIMRYPENKGRLLCRQEREWQNR